MLDVRNILDYVDATSNVTSEVDIDFERWILDIIHPPQIERRDWSDSFVYVTNIYIYNFPCRLIFLRGPEPIV